MQIDPQTNLGLCLNAAIRNRDADMLHSLIEANADASTFVRGFSSAYKRLSDLLSDSDREWFRLQIGGSQGDREEERQKEATPLAILRAYSPSPTDNLVPVGEVAKALKIEEVLLWGYLQTSSQKAWGFIRDGRIASDSCGIKISDLVPLCVGLAVYVADLQVARFAENIRQTFTFNR